MICLAVMYYINHNTYLKRLDVLHAVTAYSLYKIRLAALKPYPPMNQPPFERQAYKTRTPVNMHNKENRTENELFDMNMKQATYFFLVNIFEIYNIVNAFYNIHIIVSTSSQSNSSYGEYFNSSQCNAHRISIFFRYFYIFM